MRKSNAGVHVQKIGSEYSDKVSKANKQQDLMLQKQLRFIERQRHLSNSCITRNIHEIERLQISFEEATVSRSIDLKHYDQHREAERLKRYGTLPTADEAATSRQIKLQKSSRLSVDSGHFSPDMPTSDKAASGNSSSDTDMALPTAEEAVPNVQIMQQESEPDADNYCCSDSQHSRNRSPEANSQTNTAIQEN
jgi:hypothetical protein